jgi:hypothetical protein
MNSDLHYVATFNAYLHSDGLRTGHVDDARHFSRRRILDFATLLRWFVRVPRAVGIYLYFGGWR